MECHTIVRNVKSTSAASLFGLRSTGAKATPYSRSIRALFCVIEAAGTGHMRFSHVVAFTPSFGARSLVPDQ